MNHLLIICGPTATGKTKLALYLAQHFNGEIVSADSRQVYRGMDIGTGKDLPVNFEFRISNFEFNTKKISYYSNGETRIWGLDIVDPDEEFSVAHFRAFADIVLADIYKRNKVPIVVGGTGLYIKSLLEQLDDILVLRNDELRSALENASVAVLQQKLKEVYPDRLEKMNNSDRHNPRRLIRAIEIGEYNKTHKANKTNTGIQNYDKTLVIGLRAQSEVLRKRIDKRVDQRIKQGMVDEINTLLKKGYSKDLPSMSATGYRLLISNKYQSAIPQEVIQKWKQEEYQYAKRQMVWFKKQQGVAWFDTEQKDWQKAVVDRVKEWYTES